MFKEKFKYYKQKCPLPDFCDVLDFRSEESIKGKVIQKEPCQSDSINNNKNFNKFFKPVNEWKIYEIKDRPGLLFIQNPWTSVSQRYWIARCLLDYTKRPNKLNLDIHEEIESCDLENWWLSAQKDVQCGGEKGLLKKLRWATLGYHHNWGTKHYSEDNKSEFPQDLWSISRYIAKIVGGWNDFNAQAAIINFYHPDCTLSGHQDKSEHNMTAPLLSFSFGLSAIFLIGGSTLEEDPVAMFIDSGDIVIMYSDSRQSYHAIPRIMTSETRKVPDSCYNCVSNCDSVSNKINAVDGDFNLDILSAVQSDENYWTQFKNYVDKSRVNMNVRQVLFSNENKLP